MKITCAQCGLEVDRSIGSINRAKRLNAPLYCSMKCSGLSRRKNITAEQFKANKAEYDRQYLAKNIDTIKAKKHEHFKKTYDPISAADYRRERMHLHVQYCRRPEYKAKKIHYDRERRAKMFYGDFWECAILVEAIDKHIVAVADKQHLRTINGTSNKSTKRKKQWLRLMKNLPQLT